MATPVRLLAPLRYTLYLKIIYPSTAGPHHGAPIPCLHTDAPTTIPLPPFPSTTLLHPPAPIPYLPPAKQQPMSIPTPKTSSSGRSRHKRTPASIHEEIFHQPPQTLTPAQMDTLISSTLDKEETIPSDTPLRQAIGKTMYPSSLAANHATTPLLKE